MSAVGRFIERIRGVPPIVADAALALAILSLNLIEVLFFREDAPPFEPWGFLIFAVLCLGLVARRRYVWITYGLLQGITLGVVFWLGKLSATRSKATMPKEQPARAAVPIDPGMPKVEAKLASVAPSLPCGADGCRLA